MGTEVTPESFVEQVGWVREELERAGRDPRGFTFSLHLPTFAWPGEDAWERVREHAWYVEWKYEEIDGARGRAGPPPLSAGREAELRAGIVLGGPEQVAEEIRRFAHAAGGDFHYIARLYWPGMDPGLQREALAVFAEEVIPGSAERPALGASSTPSRPPRARGSEIEKRAPRRRCGVPGPLRRLIRSQAC